MKSIWSSIKIRNIILKYSQDVPSSQSIPRLQDHTINDVTSLSNIVDWMNEFLASYLQTIGAAKNLKDLRPGVNFLGNLTITNIPTQNLEAIQKSGYKIPTLVRWKADDPDQVKKLSASINNVLNRNFVAWVAANKFKIARNDKNPESVLKMDPQSPPLLNALRNMDFQLEQSDNAHFSMVGQQQDDNGVSGSFQQIINQILAELDAPLRISQMSYIPWTRINQDIKNNTKSVAPFTVNMSFTPFTPVGSKEPPLSKDRLKEYIDKIFSKDIFKQEIINRFAQKGIDANIMRQVMNLMTFNLLQG